MRICLIILFLALFYNSDAQNENPKVIRATSQKWECKFVTPNLGYNYSVVILVKLEDGGLVPGTLWVKGKSYPVYIKDVTTDNSSFIELNVIAQELLVTKSDSISKYSLWPSYYETMPIGFHGAGLVSYYVGDKVFYLEIEKFEELPIIQYK